MFDKMIPPCQESLGILVNIGEIKLVVVSAEVMKDGEHERHTRRRIASCCAAQSRAATACRYRAGSLSMMSFGSALLG